MTAKKILWLLLRGLGWVILGALVVVLFLFFVIALLVKDA